MNVNIYPFFQAIYQLMMISTVVAQNTAMSSKKVAQIMTLTMRMTKHIGLPTILQYNINLVRHYSALPDVVVTVVLGNTQNFN